MIDQLKNQEELESFLSILKNNKKVHVHPGSRCFVPFLVALACIKLRKNVVLIREDSKSADEDAANIQAFFDIFDKKIKTYSLNHPEENTVSPLFPRELIPLYHHFCSSSSQPSASILNKAYFDFFTLPDKGEIKKRVLTLKKNRNVTLDKLIRNLSQLGYERVKYVEVKGEMAQRGGIFDIFPVNMEHPVRLEFFGDQIESLRSFSPLDQGSLAAIEKHVVIYPADIPQGIEELSSLFFEGSLIFSEKKHEEDLFKSSKPGNMITFDLIDEGFRFDVVSPDLYLPFIPGQSVQNTLSSSLKDLQAKIIVTAPDEYALNDCKKVLQDIPVQASFLISRLSHGFYWKSASLFLMTYDDLFRKYAPQKIGKAFSSAKLFEKLTEHLKKGDIVVHTQYGIGRFIGTTRMKRAEGAREHIVLEYADKATLYVPQDQFFMVQKYMGLHKKDPALDSLHSKKWGQKKKKIQKDLFEYATELLQMEAERNMAKGFAFRKNPDWVREFQNSFLYEDTADQKKTTREVFEDMENLRPMDRLVLGDVGYGKTEIAVRAAFKAAVNNKQTAVLVPTTILAEQHGNTFRERMASFPLNIGVLSRFQTEQKQKETLKELESGSIDIVIGTHRLLQPDIKFKDLGLLIIDEEQKFGVKQKNTLKSFRKTIDILTLSATPIPRTLYLSMMGTRNISLIQTPPLDRKPIKTIVTHADKAVIRKAINTERQRNGQVYVIHNRIKTIFGVAKWIEQIVPEARIAVAHGQMDRNTLKTIMEDFYEGKTDVLISTIIIQSGIDIQNVNTMIIHNADMFGLADLYQLRGRIGRADKLAYAYFLISGERISDKNVAERIQAIREFSSPGGHFKVALKDLEIRGAGNILGTGQSGHIAIIGFDLYCKLLDDTVKTIKGKEVIPLFDVSVDLGVSAFIPVDYIPDFMERFQFYKRAYSVSHEDEVEIIKDEMHDRFGTLPKEASLFLKMARIKWLARRSLVSRIQLKNEKIFFYRNNDILTRIGVLHEVRIDTDLLFGLVGELLRKMKAS